MLAPISWRTPPRHYGPWELVTSLLTEALVARGVDVTLFATKDSQTAGKLAGVCLAPYSEDPTIDAKVWEMLHVAHVFERAAEFDLIHNQADFVPLAFSRLVETPVVTTIHGFSSERILPAFKAYEDRVHYVAISDADRHADLRYAATIHHGIQLEDFPFDPDGSEDLLFFGRIHPDKGAAEAIAAARRAVGGWSWRASCRIKIIITNKSHLRSTTVPWSIAARWAGRTVRKPWVPCARFSISSISRSRSDFQSWRRSPAARRSSPPTEGRCPS
jgi:glycosyltransferase involved in cell wall biosynthesis